jgi:hypothetical protein
LTLNFAQIRSRLYCAHRHFTNPSYRYAQDRVSLVESSGSRNRQCWRKMPEDCIEPETWYVALHSPYPPYPNRFFLLLAHSAPRGMDGAKLPVLPIAGVGLMPKLRPD